MPNWQLLMADLATKHMAARHSSQTEAKFAATAEKARKTLEESRWALTVAEDDFEFFEQHHQTAAAKALADRQALSDGWLTLINCGISHRHLMRILAACNG